MLRFGIYASQISAAMAGANTCSSDPSRNTSCRSLPSNTNKDIRLALRFAKLTRDAVRKLEVGQRIAEHGIVAERTRKGDLRYSVNVMVDGERIHRVIGTESAGVTREQAERAIESFRTRAREERLQLPTGRKTALGFGEAAERYIELLRNGTGRGVERKRQHLDARLKPHFGAVRLKAIAPSQIDTFVQIRRLDGAAPSTINRELATLSHFLRASARWGWIKRDEIPALPRLQESAGRRVVLNHAQGRSLLEAARSDQDADIWLFIMICTHTAMRHGEARRLMWEYLDLDRRRFFIPKAKAGEREQPITAELATTLKREMAVRGEAEGYIFKGGAGSTTGYRHTFRKAFRRSVIRAGLDPEQITPHVLRHTAITRLVKARVDLPTIQKVSGHKTLSMVLRYAHVDGAHIDEAIMALESTAG